MPAVRSRFAVIFFTVLIVLIGFGIVIPIVPYYAKRFGASGFEFGALLGVYSLMQFFAAAVLGRLSDRVGRRPGLLTTMVLNTGGYLLFAFAGSYWALFASRVIGGFAGGNISAAQAYIADSTSAADRSRGMGILGAAFGLGFVIGPAIGGAAAGLGSAAPGLVAAGLSLLNFVLAWAILPESLHPDHRTERRGLGFDAIARGLADRRLRPLMLVWGIFPFAFAGYTAALPYHAAAEIGAVPFAHSSLVLYAATVALALCQGAVSPAASGLVSVYASPNEQGSTLGAAQALGALGRTLGPEAIGGAYDAAGARAAFLAAAGVMALAWLATLGLEKEPSGQMLAARGDG